jgi:hypothetical protein
MLRPDVTAHRPVWPPRPASRPAGPPGPVDETTTGDPGHDSSAPRGQVLPFSAVGWPDAPPRRTFWRRMRHLLGGTERVSS